MNVLYGTKLYLKNGKNGKFYRIFYYDKNQIKNYEPNEPVYEPSNYFQQLHISKYKKQTLQTLVSFF